MRKFTLFLALMFFIGMQVVQAQTRTITGSVTNAEDGSSIPGVSVVVKGTTYGTTTDLQGKFNLNVPPDAKSLIFSFVGMKTTERNIGAENVINVSMEPEVTAIEGVVVTALGITREKKALGYAVQDLGGEDITKAQETNLVNSLSGKISGVQITNASGAVGSSSRIIIRGNKSFGDNQPLFVIDGVPVLNTAQAVDQYGGVDFGNAAMDIDPNSVENISVLKGANAAALYGSRAANGVVLITTKKGTGKKAKGGIGVDFTSSVTFDNVYVIPKYQDEYGQGFDGEEFVVKANDVDPSNLAAYQDWAENHSFSYYDGNWGGVNDGIDESWGPRLDIGLNLPQFNSPLTNPDDPSTRTATPWVSNPDNVKDFFETGYTYINTLNINGGNEKGSFRLGLSNHKQDGAIPNTDLMKNNISFSGTLNVTDKLTAQASANYTQNKSDNLPGGGYDENNIMQSIGSWFGRQVDMNDLRDNWYKKDAFGNPYNWNRSYHNNPYWTTYRNTTPRTRDRVFGNVNLTYKFNDWLSLMGRIGTDFFNEERKHFTADQSIESSSGGAFWVREYFEQETNADLLLTANKKLTPDFNLDVNLGANYRNQIGRNKFMSAAELTVPDLYTIANVKGNPSVSMYRSEKETNSVFGSASLGYKGFLYLDVTARNDWSSTLPPEEWSYFYPSVSLSFVFTELTKIDPSILSYGKVRGSWAKVGGDTGPYNLYATYSPVADPFNGVAQYFYSRTLPPLVLLPEQSYSTEFGFDLRFLNNRLGFDFTYYDILTQNQIMSVNISNATGFNNMRLNAGEIQNTGMEIQLTAKVIDNPNSFNWDIDVNWAKNKNKVNELYGDLEAYTMATSWGGLTIEARPGEEFGVIRGGAFARDDKGNILVNPASGLRVKNPTPKNIGSITPDWIGGIRNTFTYKGLSFSFLIDGRMGGDLFSVTKWFGDYAGITEKSVEGGVRENGAITPGVYGKIVSGEVVYLDAEGNVTDTPVTNDMPIAAQDYFAGYWGIQEYGIIDGSYIKLREIVLSYDLPTKWVEKVGFLNAVNVSFIGRNLALLYTDESNDVGIDPETGFGTTLSGLGLEQYQLPPTRSLGFSLRLNF